MTGTGSASSEKVPRKSCIFLKKCGLCNIRPHFFYCKIKLNEKTSGCKISFAAGRMTRKRRRHIWAIL